MAGDKPACEEEERGMEEEEEGAGGYWCSYGAKVCRTMGQAVGGAVCVSVSVVSVDGHTGARKRKLQTNQPTLSIVSHGTSMNTVRSFRAYSGRIELA